MRPSQQQCKYLIDASSLRRRISRLECQCEAVHAVAQASGGRSVVKHMPQMAPTRLAPNLCSWQERYGVVKGLYHRTCIHSENTWAETSTNLSRGLRGRKVIWYRQVSVLCHSHGMSWPPCGMAWHARDEIGWHRPWCAQSCLTVNHATGTVEPSCKQSPYLYNMHV